MSDFRSTPVATSISVHVRDAAAVSVDVQDSYVSIDIGEYPTKVVVFLSTAEQAQALVAAATEAAEALSAREAVLLYPREKDCVG